MALTKPKPKKMVERNSPMMCNAHTANVRFPFYIERRITRHQIRGTAPTKSNGGTYPTTG
ncbi:hypothetical protein GHT06_012860 [Daphnia sinensis]|uniref:Uncharacterized protein n=1 Tax=Daphnia sinensis TaxID=1820382 RepID=A0AAD5PXV2_9CRUS|nr:hypothetical protein GHT06_012860 [Daphnia sinensis]